MAALTSKDLGLRMRAAEELFVACSAESNVLFAAVTKYASALGSSAELRPFLTLQTLGKDPIPTLVSVLGALPSDPPHVLPHDPLLICIGRYGPAAKLAIPILTNRLALIRPRLDERLPGLNVGDLKKVEIRVVLANLGYRTQENLTEIENALRGHELLASDTLVTLALVQARDWVTNRIADCVVSALGDGSSNVFEAVQAFSAFGDTVEGGRRLLDRCEAWTRREGGPPSLPFVLGFAKAKVDRSNRRSLLRDALRRIGAPPEESDGLAVALWCTAATILDEDLLELSVRHLDDPEERVRLGTLRVLHVSGMRARRALPAVLRLARGSDGRWIRHEAFGTLGVAIGYSRVSDLQACLKAEKSGLVHDTIRDAIKLVNLEP